MSFDLAGARRDLVSLVGAELLPERPNDTLLDEAIRGGLDSLCRKAEPELVDYTCAAATRLLELNVSHPDLMQMVAIYAPWLAETDWALAGVPFRTLMPGVFYIEGDTTPSVGTVLRFRYRRRYRVQDLDGATETTLPEIYERGLIAFAAAELMELMVTRMLLTHPGAKEENVEVFRRAARVFRARGVEALKGAEAGFVVTWSWPELGL